MNSYLCTQETVWANRQLVRHKTRRNFGNELEFVDVLCPCLGCCFGNLLKTNIQLLNFNIIVHSVHDLIKCLIFFKLGAQCRYVILQLQH